MEEAKDTQVVEKTTALDKGKTFLQKNWKKIALGAGAAATVAAGIFAGMHLGKKDSVEEEYRTYTDEDGTQHFEFKSDDQPTEE